MSDRESLQAEAEEAEMADWQDWLDEREEHEEDDYFRFPGWLGLGVRL
jgi:poly(3-hydroxyalkanoate) synthetase